MPNFSDALQGYENGANNAVRVGAERLAIPTPVQAFLDQLHKQQELGIQRQQVQALGGYRQGLLQNAGQRIENQGQRNEDLATAASAKQALAEQKLKQALALSSRRLDIQQQIANTNGATAEGKQKLMDLQSQLAQVDLQSRDALNEAKINFYNTGGEQRSASAAKDTATTPGSGVANPKDAMTIYLKSQADADKANRTNAGIPGYVPKVPLTMEQARDMAAQFNTAPAEKDALTLADSPDAYTPSMRNSNDKLTPDQPTAPDIQPVPQAPSMPPMSSNLPPVDVPQQQNPLEALLKRGMSERGTMNKQKRLQGMPPAPTMPPPVNAGPQPPQPDMTPNYPINAGAPVPGPVIPLTDQQPVQQAAVDPLHGQKSMREPGVYSLNGRQYMVDGSGTIQALG